MKPLDSSFCFSLLIILFSLGSCISEKFDTNANQAEALSTAVSIPPDTIAMVTDTNERQIPEISSAAESGDTAKNAGDQAETSYAYGKVRFGMSKSEVEACNAKKQRLVHYTYHFTYSFNNRGELYAIYIHSEPEKTIYYETRLQSKYDNLCRIVSEKYGNKRKCGQLPSIFDVMNSKTMYLIKWQLAEKRIQIGVSQKQLDDYTVICKISHLAMEEEAIKFEYAKKNKKWKEASEKF
ncbi:MAG: hypothetical protein IPP37_14825 [Saprospiraceae bacterium]|nr:hypothetical protein [Saprospiraceae bacterium]